MLICLSGVKLYVGKCVICCFVKTRVLIRFTRVLIGYKFDKVTASFIVVDVIVVAVSTSYNFVHAQ